MRYVALVKEFGERVDRRRAGIPVESTVPIPNRPADRPLEKIAGAVRTILEIVD